MQMRRLFFIFLCLSLLILPVRAAEPEQYVVLTFDDGPSGRYTRRLLEGLAQRQVQATFLLCGYRLRDYPETAQAIFDGGHEIGLHGFTHKFMNKMTEKEVSRELTDTLALLPQGCTPVFLRPPGGMAGKAVVQAARERGLSILNWSVDPRDWRTHDAVAVEQAVLGNVQDGDVILLHDMCDSSVDAALAIVDTLQERGFHFVTASQMASLRGITPEPGTVYHRFAP